MVPVPAPITSMGPPLKNACMLAITASCSFMVQMTSSSVVKVLASRRLPERELKTEMMGRFPPGRGLIGKTCGIIGLGRIGRGIARRAEAFGMAVCYHGPHQKADVAYPYFSDLAGMAREVDCLVAACPDTPETRGLIDARVLDALGPEGFFVNVARGAVVDEQALLEALREKRIAGAGLDVYWDEPRVPAELMEMDHVVVVPHMGSATREIREERGRKLIANLRAHFGGKPVPWPLT